jgi:hypothetical protein
MQLAFFTGQRHVCSALYIENLPSRDKIAISREQKVVSTRSFHQFFELWAFKDTGIRVENGHEMTFF